METKGGHNTKRQPEVYDAVKNMFWKINSNFLDNEIY